MSDIKEQLAHIETISAPEHIKIDIRMQAIVDCAVRAANAVIHEGSDGTVEETAYLTAKVAERFVSSMMLHTARPMLLRSTLLKNKGDRQWQLASI